MAYIGNSPAELVTELDNAVVTAEKLANDAVTAAKIVDGTIIADDLSTGIIVNSKVAANAAIAATKLAISGGSNITLQSDGTFDLDASVDVTGGYSVGGTAVISSSRAGTLSSLALTGDITKASGGLTLDVAGDINLDTDSGDINLKDGGTGFGLIARRGNSNSLVIKSTFSDASFIFRGNDGGSEIDAFTLDMSEAGAATFNSDVGIGATPNTYNGYNTLTIGHATNGGLIDLELDGTLKGEIFLTSTALGFQTLQANDDIIFKGNDGGATITALTLDMSEAGAATFNSSITAASAAISGAVELGSTDSTVGDLRVYDTGNNSLRLFGVGSNSFEFDLLGTGSTGTVNFSQYNVGIGASDTEGFKMRVLGAIKLGTSGVTLGSTMLTGNYADGQEGWNIGSEYSTANIQLMYGVQPSTTAENTYISSVDNANWKRSVFKTGTQLSFQTAGAQNTSVGTAVALTERFSVLADGRTTITTTGSPAFQVNSSADSARMTIANTTGTSTFSYLELSTSSNGVGYLIKNVANTGNGLNNGSLYLWNSDSSGTGAIEFVPNQTVANRTTVEENGDLKVRGSRLTIEADTVSWSTAPHILFETTQTNTNSRHWRVGPADSGFGNFHIFPGSAQGDYPSNTSESHSGITIKNNGNVGFGCLPEAAPKLEINAGSDGAVAISGRSDGGNGNNRRFNILPISDGGTYGGGIKIQTRNTGNVFNDHLTIRHNGQINHTGDTPIVSEGSVLRTGRFPVGPDTENSTQKTPKQLGFATMYVNNWGTAGGRYIHMKTNIPSGAQGGSYGMLLIKAHGYRYSSSATINSSWGFHNWNGAVYSLNLQNHGNIAFAVNAYVASDGSVVLVGDNGSAGNAKYVGWSMDFIYTNTNYPAHTVTQSGASHAVTAHANTGSTTGAF